MGFSEYGSYDGLGLAGLVAKKKVKPSELMDEAIARAEALNPKINAIIFKDYDRARQRAKGKLTKGAFAGVPFLLKDIGALAQGLPSRQASRFIPALLRPSDSYPRGQIQVRRLDPFRCDECSRVWPCRFDGIQTLRASAQSLEPCAFHRWFVRRICGSSRGRNRAACPCK